MPSIQLIKLTIRSGTEEQRRRVILEQGELAYITDTKRLVVGDGILSGGTAVSPTIHNPLQIPGSRITLANAYKGDIVYERGLLWQLTATDATNLASWSYIGSRVDNNTISYDVTDNLQIKENGITGNKFDATAGSGGIIATALNGLSANPDYTTLGVTSNMIHILDSGVTEIQINGNALSAGLAGGDGDPLIVDIDPTVFYFAGNSLALGTLPPQIVSLSSVNPSMIGAGLVYDGSSETVYASINAVDATMELLSGTLGLPVVTSSVNRPFATIQYDDFGRIINSSSSITTTFTLSATSTSPGFAYLSGFNGYPGQTIDGSLTNVPLAMFQVISSNSTGTSTAMITLSSAGFIALATNNAQDTKNCGRFAIPVFTY